MSLAYSHANANRTPPNAVHGSDIMPHCLFMLTCLRNMTDIRAKLGVLCIFCASMSFIIGLSLSGAADATTKLTSHSAIVCCLIAMQCLLNRHKQDTQLYDLCCQVLPFLYGIVMGESSTQHPADTAFSVLSLLAYCGIWADVAAHQRQKTCTIAPAGDDVGSISSA